MDLKKREELKVQCGYLLAVNKLTPKTKQGRTFIYAYWMGAQAAIGPSPFVEICMAAGRIDDLVVMPKTK